MINAFAVILLIMMGFGTLMIVESFIDWQHRRKRRPMATRPRRRYSVDLLP